MTSLLLALLLSQNGVSVTNRTVDKAIAVRCVTQDGGGFESCAGAGGTSNVTVGAVGQGAGADGGLAWNVAGAVSVSNLPASQAVTGSFWQSTQPVSLASAPTTPVTGTFWPATQPVSLAAGVTQGVGIDGGQAWNVGGSIAVSNFPASQAVTGPVTDTQLRATPVPVSGSFFQGTQPVSLASMPSTPVTGTFFQASQPTVATQGPAADGGAEWGVRLNNAATSPSGAVYTYGVGSAPNPFPLNPFLPRCNPVRKAMCQP